MAGLWVRSKGKFSKINQLTGLLSRERGEDLTCLGEFTLAGRLSIGLAQPFTAGYMLLL